ncbi:uncharacterized protein A8924_0036 [Saccharopolyspora erythraea NRRL 2338]|uniref:DUF418 domain-containing protein n=1 Tax=Saccharopolyspora erythraea TaxID=1836 RepID=UPI00030C00A1|nr:DUF418 domain-containing protein [Saccharopolyspora erythraea]PFG92819.1 uncharacterized protein A8924_0036 [Saccharopolyspora erythraea NRRL 2338]QRK89732.1 DUF418 domain-containing protein [Saccharopolyspora erythraea]
MTTAYAQPTTRSTSGGRISALDVVRGVAIMGTLGTNIWIFTDPQGPAGMLSSADTGTFTANVEAFLRYLANGKFLALLTLMFGVGLELQYRSARRRGHRWPGWYLWRAALLFIEGLLHFVLIFEFDVLMSYAVTSMLVAYLIGRSDRAVRWWMIVMGSIHVAFISWVTLGLMAGVVSLDSGGNSTLLASGSWPEQVAARLDGLFAYRLEAIFIIPMSTVLFLLGARLMRAGVFGDDQRGRRLRARLMAIGFGVGAPLNLLTAFGGEQWFMVDRYILPPVVALGLLGLVTSAVYAMRPAPGVLRRGLTSVGRTALSCYVFQNLVAAILCYGWGFGLAAELDAARPWWVIGAWAGICLSFMVLSSLWLRRFERGPLELVWNWAYRAPQRRARA